MIVKPDPSFPRGPRQLAVFLTLAVLAGCATHKSAEFAAPPPPPKQTLAQMESKAEKGDRKAENELGLSYLNSVPPNYNSAAVWFLKAASLGYAPAQWNMGMLYSKGQGVPQDEAQATNWFRLAANQGYNPNQPAPAATAPQVQSPAQSASTTAASEISNAAVAPTIPQVRDANGAASASPLPNAEPAAAPAPLQAEIQATNPGTLLTQAATPTPPPPLQPESPMASASPAPGGTNATQETQYDKVTAAAATSRGVSSAHGQGALQDYMDAFRWLVPAAKSGDAEAQYSLGVLYANGYGTKVDLVEAHVWFNLAAAQKHSLAALARDNLNTKMTAEQIQEAQRRAVAIAISIRNAAAPTNR